MEDEKNAELYQLFREANIVSVIKQRRIRWAGRVWREGQDRADKRDSSRTHQEDNWNNRNKRKTKTKMD